MFFQVLGGEICKLSEPGTQLAAVQSNISFSFPSSGIIPRLDFFTCTLLVSALSHELIYRNSGTTYAA